jgi:hypothetical protein
MFVSEFINTALVILLAASFSTLRTRGLSYTVYNSVGQDIMYAVVYTAIGPHLYLWGDWFFLSPFRRWRRASEAATQRELDELYAGSEFSLGDRYPDLLLTLFATLTYSGGMPIMLPCAAAAFWAFYYTDWFMLLRHHRRPTMYDESLAVNFCDWLPRGLALHAVGGLFAYGAGSVLPSGASPLWLPDLLRRLLLSPLIVNPCRHVELYIVAMAVLLALGYYPSLLSAAARCMCCWGSAAGSGLCSLPWRKHKQKGKGRGGRYSSAVAATADATATASASATGSSTTATAAALDDGGESGERHHDPAQNPLFTGAQVYPSYTGIYFQVVDPNRRLTDEQWDLEAELGIAQIESGIVYRVWREDGAHHGAVLHRAGQKRNTWECVDDYSYRLAAAPRYRRAVALLTVQLDAALEGVYKARGRGPSADEGLRAGCAAAVQLHQHCSSEVAQVTAVAAAAVVEDRTPQVSAEDDRTSAVVAGAVGSPAPSVGRSQRGGTRQSVTSPTVSPRVTRQSLTSPSASVGTAASSVRAATAKMSSSQHSNASAASAGDYDIDVGMTTGARLSQQGVLLHRASAGGSSSGSSGNHTATAAAAAAAAVHYADYDEEHGLVPAVAHPRHSSTMQAERAFFFAADDASAASAASSVDGRRQHRSSSSAAVSPAASLSSSRGASPPASACHFSSASSSSQPAAVQAAAQAAAATASALPRRVVAVHRSSNTPAHSVVVETHTATSSTSAANSSSSPVRSGSGGSTAVLAVKVPVLSSAASLIDESLLELYSPPGSPQHASSAQAARLGKSGKLPPLQQRTFSTG